MIIKICGVTNVDDARFAISAGADWIGLNLVDGPRRLEIGDVTRIIEQIIDPRLAVVLLRIDPQGEWESTADQLGRCGLVRAQLYGDVTAEVIGRVSHFGMSAIYVQPVAGGASLAESERFFHACNADRPEYVLVDAADGKKWGGTGQRVDWELLRRNLPESRRSAWPKLLLAGGLTPDNVGKAIELVSPAGVDVCSGVESTPGRQDHVKVRAFIAAVRGGTDGKGRQGSCVGPSSS